MACCRGKIASLEPRQCSRQGRMTGSLDEDSCRYEEDILDFLGLGYRHTHSVDRDGETDGWSHDSPNCQLNIAMSIQSVGIMTLSMANVKNKRLGRREACNVS